MSEVKGFKLINGYEIIGKVNEIITEDGILVYKIEDAFFMSPIEQQNGQLSVQLLPMTLFGKIDETKKHRGFDIPLPVSQVLFPFAVNEGVADMYLKHVSPIDLSLAPSARL